MQLGLDNAEDRLCRALGLVTKSPVAVARQFDVAMILLVLNICENSFSKPQTFTDAQDEVAKSSCARVTFFTSVALLPGA